MQRRFCFETRLACFLFAASCIFGQRFKISPTLISDHSLPSIGASGRWTIPAREGYARVPFPSGKADLANILVAFDPANGSYLWYIAAASQTNAAGDFSQKLSANAIHYVTPDRMIVFWGRETALLVRESRRRAKSLDEAWEASLRQIEQASRVVERGEYPESDHHYIQVSLQRLGPDFPKPVGAANSRDVTIVDVARLRKRWEVTLEGAKQAKLLLDDYYKVVSFQK
jgi:hypothetical protein